MSSTTSNRTGFICELCGLSFNSQGEKEEHIKLEHAEHKQPSGVS